MPEHFTKSVMQAKFRCAKCNKDTMHYVHDGRRGGCMECIAKQEAKPKPPPPPAKQESLF
jgi:hypothetical protein